MSGDDNASLQRDEVEALSSIYGDEWCVVDACHQIYCIQVNDGQDRPMWIVCLQVHLPPDYPSESPPEYQLNAPWLRGDEKRNLEVALSDIYCDHLGESIIFMWVEKIREFLQGKVTEPNSDNIIQSLWKVTTTTEENDDDDFDNSMLELHLDSTSVHSSNVSEDWECPAISHGECITDRKSTFQPHLAPIFHKSQIKLVIEKLYENKKIANATHNILAFRIVRHDPHPIVQQGCDDDGETHAGSRMLHLLKILDVENVMVVVSRWYGGILLGADRFKHINSCTRSILEQRGYIKEKEEKKGPKSGSDKKKR